MDFGSPKKFEVFHELRTSPVGGGRGRGGWGCCCMDLDKLMR